MNKRGISAIVATVLVILITVAAVSIIWVGILPMISEGLEFSALDGRVSVVSGGGYTLYDAAREVAMVQVKREVDEGAMNRIVVSFLIDGNSVSSSVVAPASGGVKTYSFDLSGYGEPSSVEVAPIFSSGSKEKVGGVTSSVDISSGVIGSVIPVTMMYDIGEDYFDDFTIDGLVSWWEFDGDVEDSVGSNDGSLNGGSLDGDVFNVDNVGNVVIPASSDFDFGTGDWTFSAWVYSTSITACDTIFAQQSPYYILRVGCAGPVSTYDVYHDDTVYTTSSHGASNNNWYYVVLIRRGDTLELYQNTLQLLSQNIVEQSTNMGHAEWIIGDSSWSIEHWSGKIDDFMVFDRALSQEEIDAIYEIRRK